MDRWMDEPNALPEGIKYKPRHCSTYSCMGTREREPCLYSMIHSRQFTSMYGVTLIQPGAHVHWYALIARQVTLIWQPTVFDQAQSSPSLMHILCCSCIAHLKSAESNTDQSALYAYSHFCGAFLHGGRMGITGRSDLYSTSYLSLVPPSIYIE